MSSTANSTSISNNRSPITLPLEYPPNKRAATPSSNSAASNASNRKSGTPITLDNIAGNHAALRIAADRYVTYAHLQNGSIKVRPHQQVYTGDVLALLRNSGNTPTSICRSPTAARCCNPKACRSSFPVSPTSDQARNTNSTSTSQCSGRTRSRRATACSNFRPRTSRACTDSLVSARTTLVNAARGLVKSYGERLRKCGTEQFRRETTSGLSAGLREALEPLLGEVESLNERIREYDRRIEKMKIRWRNVRLKFTALDLRPIFLGQAIDPAETSPSSHLSAALCPERHTNVNRRSSQWPGIYQDCATDQPNSLVHTRETQTSTSHC